jgi:hypothetical protein
MEGKAIVTWNTFIASLAKAEQAWDEYREIRRLMGIDVATNMTKANYRSRFNVMLPNFIAYANSRGGLAGLLVPLPEKAEEQVVEDITIIKEEEENGRKGRARLSGARE